jgi:hypothetical protein
MRMTEKRLWSLTFGDFENEAIMCEVCDAIRERDALREKLSFMANQNDLAGNWAVENARSILAKYPVIQ